MLTQSSGWARNYDDESFMSRRPFIVSIDTNTRIVCGQKARKVSRQCNKDKCTAPYMDDATG